MLIRDTTIALSSSYRQWGFSSLDEDVAEIAQFVKYFHALRPDGRMVLLGHSTGSQQCMHYLLSRLLPTPLPRIDGVILQAGISDREALTSVLPPSEYQKVCTLAQTLVDCGRGKDILPSSVTDCLFPSTPISARRWLSIASPGPSHEGQDDFFSSDFEDQRLQRTFGKLGSLVSRISILFGGNDQYVPNTVDKSKLVERWHERIRQGGGVIDEGSGLVGGASHTLKEGGKGLEDLLRKVVGFLQRLEGNSET